MFLGPLGTLIKGHLGPMEEGLRNSCSHTYTKVQTLPSTY